MAQELNSGWHVVNGAIRQKKQYLVGVLALIHYRLDIVFELCEERGEESGTAQADLRQSLPVRAHYS